MRKEIVIKRLADLADQQGMRASDVIKHADLLKLAGLKASDVSPATANSADTYNKEQLAALRAKYKRQTPIREVQIVSKTNPRKQQTQTHEERTMSQVTLNKASVVELFVALGFATAAKWNESRLIKKIEGLTLDVAEDSELDKTQMKLLKQIVKAIEAEEEIAFEDADYEDVDEDEEETKPVAKKPARSKKSTKVVEEPADDEDDDDDEDEEETKPVAKKPAKAKTKTPRAGNGNNREKTIELLTKNGTMRTPELRDALGLNAAFGFLAGMRDAGLIVESQKEGVRGSVWSLPKKGKKAKVAAE